jgi:hypothetical protein
MAEQILGLFCEPPIVIARLGGRQRRDCSSLSWGKTLLPDAGSRQFNGSWNEKLNLGLSSSDPIRAHP